MSGSKRIALGVAAWLVLVTALHSALNVNWAVFANDPVVRKAAVSARRRIEFFMCVSLSEASRSKARCNRRTAARRGEAVRTLLQTVHLTQAPDP